MQRSLSILLPAHNVQATLAAHVSQILDVAGELTGALEILIIDNGSTDHTFEVAHDLAVRFPQVDVMRLNLRRDFQHVIGRALPRVSGDVILARDGRKPEGERDLAPIGRFWRAESLGSPQYGWHAVHLPGLDAAHFRADGVSLHKNPPRPNFLARLRDFAFGE